MQNNIIQLSNLQKHREHTRIINPILKSKSNYENSQDDMQRLQKDIIDRINQHLRKISEKSESPNKHYRDMSFNHDSKECNKTKKGKFSQNLSCQSFSRIINNDPKQSSQGFVLRQSE